MGLRAFPARVERTRVAGCTREAAAAESLQMDTTGSDIDRLWAMPDGDLEAAAGRLVATRQHGADASIACPVPDSLPRRTPIRHVDCGAVVRCASGTIWGLRTRGTPWTEARLVTAASVLAGETVGTPTAEVALRLGFALEIQVSVHDPLQEPFDAFWAPKRIAGMVLLGLPRPAGVADQALGNWMAGRQRELEHGMRAAIAREWQRFRAGLDAQALAVAGAGGAASYNFLVAGSALQRRARQDLARTFPLLLPCALAGATTTMGGTIRQVAESGAPFVRTLARRLHVRPVVLKSLVGVQPELAGGDWVRRPRALLTLLEALRAEDLPRQGDAAAWTGFNRAVALAERLFRRAPWTSTLALCWLREAARGHWRRLEPATAASARLLERAATIDAFHDAAADALQGMLDDRGVVADRSPAAARAVLDRHLAALAPAALLRLGERFERALAAARVDLADETGRLAGSVFAALLPHEHLSASGRRRVASLTSRDALKAHGRALDICLAESYTAHYAAECAEGKTFLLGIYDARTGAPRATVELGLHRDRAIRGYGVELRQFTGRGNALPSPACQSALDEVLASVPTPSMQEHLARTAMALAERRRLSKDAAARRARLLPLDRALRVTLGEPLVGALLAEALQSASGIDLAGPG